MLRYHSLIRQLYEGKTLPHSSLSSLHRYRQCLLERSDYKTRYKQVAWQERGTGGVAADARCFNNTVSEGYDGHGCNEGF